LCGHELPDLPVGGRRADLVDVPDRRVGQRVVRPAVRASLKQGSSNRTTPGTDRALFFPDSSAHGDCAFRSADSYAPASASSRRYGSVARRTTSLAQAVDSSAWHASCKQEAKQKIL